MRVGSGDWVVYLSIGGGAFAILRVAWGALSLSTPPTQEEYNYPSVLALEDQGSRRRLFAEQNLTSGTEVLSGELTPGEYGRTALLRCRELAFPIFGKFELKARATPARALGVRHTRGSSTRTQWGHCVPPAASIAAPAILTVGILCTSPYAAPMW